VWDIFATGHGSTNHPASQIFNDPEWPGFWDSEPKDQLVSDMIGAADDETLMKAIDYYTELFYDEMPSVMLGDQFEFRAHRNEVMGYQNLPYFCFWNVGLDE